MNPTPYPHIPEDGRVTAEEIRHHQQARETDIDFNSDAPLVCNRDQSGDTTCESCQ
jgi:hypothetical protein